MPAPATIDDFLDLVHKSGLVEPAVLEGAIRNLYGDATPSNPEELATRLIQGGILTHFQSRQFLQGKWRGFTLGKYRVLEQLGRGGMGTVYLCEHQVMRHRVAIKVLPTNRAKNPSLLGRFYREARAGGALDHPNLVRAHDVDQEGNLHFLIMDYVEGTSLHDLVARFGPLAHERAAHYISQAARGLHHAHQNELIHRDVKPANLILERNGTVRVLDLGLARFCEDEDLLTLKYDDNSVLGTADYVSPEQADDSHGVTHRTDIYSLGCTFYYLLTGQPPFPDGPVAQKLIWHQVRYPTPIREIRSEVPEELQAIIERMMAKEPDDRYPDMGEVVRALAPWTVRPIPPPAEAEMPSLAPAARKRSSRVAVGPLRALLAARGTAEENRPEVREAVNGLASAGEKRPATTEGMPTRTGNGTPVGVPTAPAGSGNGRRSRGSLSPLAWREMAPTEKMVRSAAPAPAQPPDLSREGGGLARLLAAAASSLSGVGSSNRSPSPPQPVPVSRKASFWWFLCAIGIGLAFGVLIRHLWTLL
jgi:serine/threonine protein kinase